MNARHVLSGSGLLALTAVALLAAGCSPKPEEPLPPPPAAKIITFTASPTAVANPGDSVTLSWTTENATGVSVEQVGVGPVRGATATSGTASVTVQTDAIFVLTARGEGGTDARSVGVSVTDPDGTVLFAALPEKIEAGQSTTLTWFAPGAQSVSLTEVGGATIDLGTQLESGVVSVTPAASTSYRLTVDGHDFTVDVAVTPVISSFALSGPAPAPGSAVNLAWTTRGATQLVLTRVGATAPLLTETDAAKIANGAFTEVAPASLPQDGVLQYELEVSAGGVVTRLPLTVRVGRIDLTLTASGFAKVGQTVPVTWRSTGGESASLSVDGQVVFVAATAAEVSNGNYTLLGKSAPQQIELVVRNSRGMEARAAKTIEPVGLPTFNSFSANPTSIATAGSPVTLSWDVTNARRVRISQVGGGFSQTLTGTLDTGTLDVYPSRPSVTYQLEADNQAGDSISPQRTTVTVTTPALVTVSRKFPVGSSTTITGTTVPGATSITGLPTIVSNPPGEAFVDISTTGTQITDFSSADDGSALVDFGGGLDLRVFGSVPAASTLAVGTNGWMYFSSTSNATTIPSVPVGTSLQPLSFAVFACDLVLGANGKVFWRKDTVNGETRVIVQWNRVEVFNTAGTSLTFQAQLYSSGKVVYAYGDLTTGGATYSAGIVNSTETIYLSPTTQPTSGQTLSFFAPVSVSSLPIPHTVQAAPYYLTVQAGAANVEARLDDVLLAGDVYISEVNPRPLAALTNAEWIELTNTTSAAFDLGGYSLATGTLTYTFPAGVSVPANGRLLLAQAADLGDGAAVTADHLYPSTFVMADASGTLSLRPPSSTTAYARIDWNAATAPANGRSVQADRPSTSLLTAAPFSAPTCPAPLSATYGTSLQNGTPGAAQGRCFPYVVEPLPMGNFEPISATGTQLVAGSASASDTSTYQVTLPQAVTYFGTPSTTLSVCTNGWLTTATTTSTSATNKTAPSTTAPVGTIAPFWDDNAGDPGTMGSGMYWLQRDPDMTPGSGDEVTIVSWEGWRYWSTTYAGQILDFQVKFFANGDIEFHYGRQVAGTYSTGLSATTWIENPAGNTALAINVNSTTAPGIQGNTGFRFRYVP